MTKQQYVEKLRFFAKQWRDANVIFRKHAFNAEDCADELEQLADELEAMDVVWCPMEPTQRMYSEWMTGAGNWTKRYQRLLNAAEGTWWINT